MNNAGFLLLEVQGHVTRCDLFKALTIVGSADACELFVRGEGVAERHAQISQGDDHYWLRGIDDAPVSINDTLLDAAHALENGDRIGVGAAEFLFVLPPLVSSITLCLLIRRPEAVDCGYWSAKPTLSIGTAESDMPLVNTGLDGVELILENFCEGGQFVVSSHEDSRILLNGSVLEGRSRLIQGDVLRMGDAEIQVYFGESLLAALPEQIRGPAPRNRFAPTSGSRPRSNSCITGHKPRSLSGQRRRSLRRNTGSHLKRSLIRDSSECTDERRVGEVELGTVLGNPDLWYMPNDSSSERPRLPRPIIRARGDSVPESNPQSGGDTQDQRDSGQGKDIRQRARIRRPKEPDHISTQDLRRPPMESNDSRGPGARGDSRWYVPSRAGAPEAPPRADESIDSRWYLPETPSESERVSSNREEAGKDVGFSEGRRRSGTRDCYEADP